MTRSPGRCRAARRRTRRGRCRAGSAQWTANIVPGGQQAGDLGGEDRPALGLSEIADDLADRENADGDDDEADAVAQFGDAEAEALHAGIDVGPDDAEQQAEHHHRQRLDHIALRQHGGGHQAHQHQREIFRRGELQRDLGQRRRRTGRSTACRSCRPRTSRWRRWRAPVRPGLAAPSGGRRCT